MNKLCLWVKNANKNEGYPYTLNFLSYLSPVMLDSSRNAWPGCSKYDQTRFYLWQFKKVCPSLSLTGAVRISQQAQYIETTLIQFYCSVPVLFQYLYTISILRVLATKTGLLFWYNYREIVGSCVVLCTYSRKSGICHCKALPLCCLIPPTQH